MSFVDRFYSFVIDYTSVERNFYQKLRLKLPKYPNEELSDLLYRVLAYLHSYSPALQFSANPLDHRGPILYQLDFQESYAQWISVGLPDLKELRLASRRFEGAAFAIYFVSQHQIERFCHALRGTKENWITSMNFYLIKGDLFDQLLASLGTSSPWQVNHVENTLYIERSGQSIEIEFTALEMWAEYQKSLAN